MGLLLNKNQVRKLSDFLIDLSKIFFASTVVVFFAPNSSSGANIYSFGFGFIASCVCLISGLKLTEK